MNQIPNNKHQFTIKPAIEILRTGDQGADIVSNTKAFSTVIEEYVRDAYDQWVWMHERWKTTPEKVEELKKKGVIKS